MHGSAISIKSRTTAGIENPLAPAHESESHDIQSHRVSEILQTSGSKILAAQESDLGNNESPQWTAVYPLPSLSNFTKRIFHQRKTSDALLDKRFCTTSSVLASNIERDIAISEEIPPFRSYRGCWLCSARELPNWHFRVGPTQFIISQLALTM